MLREKAKIVAHLLLVADIAAVLLAFPAAYVVREILLGSMTLNVDLVWHARLLLFALPVLALSLNYFGLYESFRLRPLSDEVFRLAKAWAVTGIVLIICIFLFKYGFVSRTFLAVFGLLGFLFVTGERIIVRLVARGVRRQGYNTRNVVIVGTGVRVREMAEAVREHTQWGLRLIGQICEDDEPADLGMPQLGNLAGFAGVLESHVVDCVVFVTPNERLSLVRDAFAHCRSVGVPVYMYARPFDEFNCRFGLEDLGGIKLLSFPVTVHNDYQLFWKRIFDFCTSVILLLSFGPLMIVTAALIRLTSSGHILFRQTRVGMNGRLFTLYKFRTMIQDAEKLKANLQIMNQMDGPVFKIRNDPRVTWVGAFLRRTSLDELPQLLNVLLGHMSIVGPRPPLPEEVEKYETWQRRRLSVRPGLTCLWQVNGRNKIDFQTWMKLDLEYIDNWSWALDLAIVFRTIPAMFRGH